MCNNYLRKLILIDNTSRFYSRGEYINSNKYTNIEFKHKFVIFASKCFKK